MNIKKFIKKIRIFKRIKELTYKIEQYREENNLFKDMLIAKRKEITKLKECIMNQNNKYSKLAEKHKKASNHVATAINAKKQLERRRDEFLKRLQSKIPDEVIGGRLENYKYWLAEPFIVEKYDEHHKVDEKTTFVDHFAAYRGIDKVLREVENEIKGEEKDT